MNEYNLNRFIKAQNECFEIVYQELNNGKKESEWMWFIFPRIFGLGETTMDVYYAINSLDEAKAYLENETLRERLIYLVELLVNSNINDAVQIFGFPDNIKFWSSMTLFNYVDEKEISFKKALDKFFQGRLELATIEILKDQSELK